MRCTIALLSLSVAICAHAAAMPAPDALNTSHAVLTDDLRFNAAAAFADLSDLSPAAEPADASQSAPAVESPQTDAKMPTDGDAKPIPLERQQPKRIMGFMPNFRSVSSGSEPHPPGWKYNFSVATHQSTDYSSFIFLGITSLTAEGLNQHPSLGKGVSGAWAYTWRGFLDKSDNTYLSAYAGSGELPAAESGSMGVTLRAEPAHPVGQEAGRESIALRLADEDGHAAVSLNWFEKPKKWLLTAYRGCWLLRCMRTHASMPWAPATAFPCGSFM